MCLRLFMALFLADMPSYTALGFETRDLHHRPAPNEHYSKLYVFQERTGPKATWRALFVGKKWCTLSQSQSIEALRRSHLFPNKRVPDPLADRIQMLLPHRNILPGHRSILDPIISLSQIRTQNTTCSTSTYRSIPGLGRAEALEFEFSTAEHVSDQDRILKSASKGYKVAALAAREGRVYRVRYQTSLEPRHRRYFRRGGKWAMIRYTRRRPGSTGHR